MTETKPRIAIRYCTQCNWLLRAGWMAQEILQTFASDIGEVSLIPRPAVCLRSPLMGRLYGNANAMAVFPVQKNSSRESVTSSIRA